MDDSYRTNEALHSQQFHGGHGSSHTLPPLNQQQASSYPPIYGQPSNSTQQAPLSQYHPATSAPGGNVPPLRPLQPSYGLSSAAFSSAQANMNMYTTTASHGGPAPIAPAPLPGTLHELRPMPPGGLGLGHPYAPQLLSHQHQMANQEPEPIHVVGQQGRRGVLPTTPGRMAPTSAKQPINPTKNEENKFECPSCNKTYLHLKHLKRHLLRHTGERPYQCHLCKDTFSRSDILKRHFQKCSIRRGNPTGASHLAHSQAHLRKNRLSTGGTADQTFIPPMATTMAYSGTFVPSVSAVTGMPMTPEHSQYANGGSVQSLSARTSRSNSLIRPPMHENRRSMSSLDLANANRANFDTGGDFRVPASMAGTVNHGAAFASPQHQTSQVQNSFGYNPSATQSELNGDFAVKSESVNVTNFARGGGGNLQGLSHGQDDALAWPTSYNAPGQEAYLATNPSSAPPAMKTDANHFDSEYHGQNDSPDAIFGHLYTGVATFGEPNADFESWLAQNSSLSPLQLKVDSLVSFCFPDGQPADPKNISILKSILTVENVQHFVKLYGNFHSHWPLIHFPSFNIDSTSSGLLMTMICVGAVYSDRIDQDTVRWLMSVVNAAVHNTSRIFTYSPTDSIPPENMRSDIEDVQTLILLQAILVWHGTPETRANASAQYQPKIVNAAKTLGLLQTFGYDHPKCSILHEPGPIPDPQTLKNSWSWAEWVEQEKCIRTLYLLLLVDAAFVIFFNAPPNFNIRDIRLPLPADDAAWEARTAGECANALGLYGPKKQAKNITGSRQLKQMQIGEAFKIMQSSHDFQRCSTNVYSKFILIHALHIQIWYIHRLLVYPAQSPVTPTQSIMAFSSNSSGTSSPLAHNEWVGPDGSTGPLGAGHSGHTTPTEGMMSSSTYTPQLQHDLKALKTSMDRWKRSWDSDLALQYPPPTPRTGFCRDGIHYYHLANYLLRAKPMEWQLPSEARMQRTFHLLNQIKSRVANEQEFKGLDKGSLTHMDDGYALTTTIDHGVEKLTLDMKRLFTPVEGSGSQDEATP